MQRKSVICPFLDEETKGSYPFANGLNGLNGLAHLRQWTHGDMETWRHGDGDTGKWRHRHGDIETWRNGDAETWRHQTEKENGSPGDFP
jgi:hypothetical protein